MSMSKEDWENVRQHYIDMFDGLDFPIESVEDQLVWHWKELNKDEGKFKSAEAMLKNLDNILGGMARLKKSHKEVEYVSEDIYDDLFARWEKVAHQVTWDGSKVDDMIIDQTIELETDIEMHFRKRIKHGLPMNDRMRAFKGLVKISEERLDALLKEEAQETKEELSDGYPPIDEVEDWNGALYTLGDDLIDEWKKKHRTEEFRCFKNMTDFLTWCSYKWTYDNGNQFTAHSIQVAVRVARARGRID